MTQMATKPALTPINPEALAAVRAAAPSEALLAAVVDLFEVLADPTRARIVYALLRCPLRVRDLALLVGVSESGVSHQMRFLRERHVVKRERHGNSIEYSLDNAHVGALIREAEYHADHVRQGLPDHPYEAP